MPVLLVAGPKSDSRPLAEGEFVPSDASMVRGVGVDSGVAAEIVVAVGFGTGGGVIVGKVTSVGVTAGGRIAAGAASAPQATTSRDKKEIRGH